MGTNFSHSWLEISKQALNFNVASFKSVLDVSGFGAVLKANAYGHGLHEVLEICHSLLDFAYVISSADALSIRKWEHEHDHSPVRILVIGCVTLDEVIAGTEKNIEFALGDPDWFDFVDNLKKPAKVHVHLDTGLGRYRGCHDPFCQYGRRHSAGLCTTSIRRF
jgi:alanine racemase